MKNQNAILKIDAQLLDDLVNLVYAGKYDIPVKDIVFKVRQVEQSIQANNAELLETEDQPNSKENA